MFNMKNPKGGNILTGAGSARPVVSIIIPSNFPPVFSQILCKLSTKSPRTVQQMQPFFTSKIKQHNEKEKKKKEKKYIGFWPRR